MSVNKLSRGKTSKARQHILVAASRLFREKGFLGTTLDDIASQGGLSKAAIYNYFPTKQYLLYEILCSVAQQMVDQGRLILQTSDSPIDCIQSLVKLQVQMEAGVRVPGGGVGAFERRNLPLKLRKSYISLRDQYEHIFRCGLQQAMSAGQIRQCDVELTSRLILGLINFIPHWFKPTGPLSPDDIANEIWELISYGLACRETTKLSSQNVVEEGLSL